MGNDQKRPPPVQITPRHQISLGVKYSGIAVVKGFL